jgi:putative redox protein
MPRIEVNRELGVRFRALVRGHAITFDQPIDVGGTDAGPTPTEVFVASLAGCVAYYVERFLDRHAIDGVGLRVIADFAMAEHPSRVGVVELRVIVPCGVPEKLRAPLLAVAEHCTVHNSIAAAPRVQIELETARHPATSLASVR